MFETYEMLNWMSYDMICYIPIYLHLRWHYILVFFFNNSWMFCNVFVALWVWNIFVGQIICVPGICTIALANHYCHHRKHNKNTSKYTSGRCFVTYVCSWSHNSTDTYLIGFAFLYISLADILEKYQIHIEQWYVGYPANLKVMTNGRSNLGV